MRRGRLGLAVPVGSFMGTGPKTAGGPRLATAGGPHIQNGLINQQTGAGVLSIVSVNIGGHSSRGGVQVGSTAGGPSNSGGGQRTVQF